MPRERLPVYVNHYPDGRLTLTCAHCAIDAELEQAEAVALYAEGRDDGHALAWEAALSPEQVIAAAADQCMHLAAYRVSALRAGHAPGDPSS